MKLSRARVEAWRGSYGHVQGEALLVLFLREKLAGRIALLSSFGADAAAPPCPPSRSRKTG